LNLVTGDSLIYICLLSSMILKLKAHLKDLSLKLVSVSQEMMSLALCLETAFRSSMANHLTVVLAMTGVNGYRS
jgi:hypothetical protein